MISTTMMRTPMDSDREALRVHRINKERVCKKRLAIRNDIDQLMYEREMKRINAKEIGGEYEK